MTQPYLRIASDLAERIRSGALRPHDQLPSNRELREEYGVSAGTVQRALNDLRAARLIYSHQGRGSYVHADPAPEDTAPPATDLERLQQQITGLAARLARIEDRLAQEEEG